MRGRIRAVVSSEWTKLISTRMMAVCVQLAVTLSVGAVALLAIAMASADASCARAGSDCSGEPLRPDVLVSTFGVIGDGTPGLGLASVMILGALVVCAEYRHGTIGTTFIATPRRSDVLLAKAAIVMTLAAVVGLLATVLSAATFAWLGGGTTEALELASPQALRTYATVTIVVTLSAGIAVAVGSIVRNSVVAVTIVITWPAIVEPLLTALPGIGARVADVLPYANARHFIGLDGGAEPPWTWSVSGVYLLVVTVVAMLAALVHQSHSDVPSP